MCEMSGSLDFPSGVGTQMMIASAGPSAPTPAATVSRPVLTRGASSSLGTSSIGLWPRPISEARPASASAPITRMPALAKATASGSPT